MSASPDDAGAESVGTWKRQCLWAGLAPALYGCVLGVMERAGYVVPLLVLALMFAFVYAFATAVIAVVTLPSRPRRARRRLAWSTLLIASAMVGGRVYGAGRMSAFAMCAERAKPMIAAIDAYCADHGDAPEHLVDLVPKYLTRVPGTGMRRYPSWGYSREEVERYELMVSCGELLDFDKFVYWPSGNYPSYMYGGTIERIGAWVYVHE